MGWNIEVIPYARGLSDLAVRGMFLIQWHSGTFSARKFEQRIGQIEQIRRRVEEERNRYLVTRKIIFSILPLLVLVLSGCDGSQSALDPAGTGAARIAGLFWWLTGIAIVIWIAVVGLAIYAVRLEPGPHELRWSKLLIIGGGVVFPTVVLTGVLIYGLAMLPDLLAPAPEGSMKIQVSGEQWWWRVQYEAANGETIELANEIRLPVGERVDLLLDSPDVIHSFWVPSLTGKIDMIPGRINRLTLEATQTGTFRGACAEYCGESHALMSFYVVVMEKQEFTEWLEQEARPAQDPVVPLAASGQELFIVHGCGSCHTIRGTAATGIFGPDLTHVGNRVSLGGGILPNEPPAFVRWIADTEDIKPGVHMPAFGMLPGNELQAIAAYLEGLE